MEKVHLTPDKGEDRNRVLCGRAPSFAIGTTDPKQITCKWCQKAYQRMCESVES